MSTINARDYLKSQEVDRVKTATGISLNFRGEYVDGTYVEGDAVVSNGWFSTVKKGVAATTDLPVPQNVGAIEYGIDANAVFTETSVPSIIRVVHTYTMLKDGYLTSLSIKSPTWDSDTVTKVSLGINGSWTVANSPILTPTEWTHLGVGNTIIGAGSTVEVAFDFKKVNAANNISGGWNSNIGTGEPADQTFNISNVTGSGTLVMDHIDLDTITHETELRGVQIGSTVTLVETADSSRSTSVIITGLDSTNTLGYSTYTYDHLSTGSKGSVRSGKVVSVSIDVPVVTDSKYYALTNGFATHPATFANVSTYAEHNGVNQNLPTDNAYGIALGFQEAFVSDDWQALAATETGSSGAEISDRITAQNLERNDYELVLATGNNLGTTLNRNEIEAVLALYGIPEPVVNVTFKILDGSERVFIVSYIATIDQYMYERLSKAL